MVLSRLIGRIRKTRKAALTKRRTRPMFLETLEDRRLLTGAIRIFAHEVDEGQNTIIFEVLVTRDQSIEREDYDTVTVSFTLGSFESHEAALGLNYTVTAWNGVSMSGNSGQVTFLPNESEKFIHANIATDEVWDPNKIITLSIDNYESSADYDYDYDQPLPTEVFDTNGPHVSITANSSAISESSGNWVTFTVTREAPALSSLHMDLRVNMAGSGAASEGDYEFDPPAPRDIPKCCGRRVIEKGGVLGENGCFLDTFFPRSTPRWKLLHRPFRFQPPSRTC